MSDKTIYMAGTYEYGVAVTSQLSNGDNVVATGKYAHAEGKDTTASADYSHSDGVNSTASDKYSYVFNGDYTAKYNSHGEGTFNVNTKKGIADFYIGNQSLSAIIYSAGGANTILKSNNEFTGTNNFTKKTVLATTEITGDVAISNNINVSLANGNTYVKTANIYTNDTTAASTEFVHKLIQEYFKKILNTSVITA